MVFSNYLFVSFSLYSVFNELRGLFRTLYFWTCVRGIMPLVGPSGLEPPTSRLSGVRSNHLSYEPEITASLFELLPNGLAVVEMVGVEPMTSCLQGRRSPS